MSPERRPAVGTPRNFYLWGCLVLLVIGAELTFFNAIVFGRELRAGSWPTTDARLVEVKITGDSTGLLDGWHLTPQLEDRFHVRYQYTVGGTDYVGNRVGMRPSAGRVGEHRNRFLLGASVTIHYNPSSPEDSVIDTVLPIINAVGVVVGALILFGAYRTYRHHLHVHRRRDASDDEFPPGDVPSSPYLKKIDQVD
jgi:hypothetical protein